MGSEGFNRRLGFGYTVRISTYNHCKRFCYQSTEVKYKLRLVKFTYAAMHVLDEYISM